MGLITLIAIGIGSVFGLFLFISLIMLRRVVPTNMVHIVQSSKATTAYGKGKDHGNTYYKWPSFIPLIGVVVSEFPESIFDITLVDYEAYDSGRLPFMVDVKAFFRVDHAETAAQRVASFDELKEQLKAVLQGSVRRILATNNLEQIMQDRSKLGGEFTDEVNTQLTEWGVTTVKSIEFMDIRDSRGSEVIQNIMAKEKSRIERESRVAVAENTREAEEKEIEARRQVDLSRQQAEQQVGIRTAEKEREVGLADEQARQQVLAETKVTTQREMEVQQVKEVREAEIRKEVAVVAADQDKQVTLVRADAERQQTIIAAEANKAQTVTIAEGQLAAARNEAEGVQALGEAKGRAETAILMAPVTAQIELAEKIAELPAYQSYLLGVRQIEATEEVGTHMAAAIGKADLKVISNSGSPTGGVAGIGDLFSPAGGTSIAGMLAALSQTEQGKALVERLTGEGQPVVAPPTSPPPSSKPRVNRPSAQ